MKRLGLQWGSTAAATLLGVGAEACKRYASGTPIPKEVVIILETSLRKKMLNDMQTRP